MGFAGDLPILISSSIFDVTLPREASQFRFPDDQLPTGQQASSSDTLGEINTAFLIPRFCPSDIRRLAHTETR